MPSKNLNLSDFSEREWNQVLAAVKFWREMAEHSRTHPSAHPRVAEMFQKHGPLNLSELDRLLERLPENAWVTIQGLANIYGVGYATAYDYVKKHGIEPGLVVRSTKVFRMEDLVPVAEELERIGKTSRRRT